MKVMKYLSRLCFHSLFIRRKFQDISLPLFLVDRIGRKKVIVSYLGLAAVAAIFLGQATSPTQILIAGFFTSLFMVGSMGGMYTYTPEQYPTIIRATGTGSASRIRKIRRAFCSDIYWFYVSDLRI